MQTTHLHYFATFKHGDVFTRLAYVLMGAGHFGHRQFVKGTLYLISEIGFLLFLFTDGLRLLSGMLSLGTRHQSWHFDRSIGIMVRTPGDNSMLLLIYGIMTIVLICLFITVYLMNIKGAGKAQAIIAAGRRPISFVQELSSFLDGRFHITLLTIPMISVILFTVMPLIYMISLAFTSYDHNHLPPRNLFGWVGLAWPISKTLSVVIFQVHSSPC